MKVMQGDSYPIYIELKQDGNCLKPEMVADLEICIGKDGESGEALRKLHSKGEVLFEESTGLWYIHPKQEETLGLDKGHYNVEARIRYKNADMEDVVGVLIGRIEVADSISEAVI